MTREIHGATPMAGTSKDPITLVEGDRVIKVRIGDWDRATLTAADARWMARKLNHLALRLEKRGQTA